MTQKRARKLCPPVPYTQQISERLFHSRVGDLKALEPLRECVFRPLHSCVCAPEQLLPPNGVAWKKISIYGSTEVAKRRKVDKQFLT
ncbi:hypothetical protein POVWA2_050290 [Plasmodium ovale wallikeri]|uniref:Uncharacterized protein n=1 Tax=Plasmodium ovale wallikeri TaxID=864142 RepID=A0A1A8ZNB2_PLAOA|nr:hypothetical protein POVWA2_050290 [Plasmodium ovale wallikeri]